MRSSSKSRLTQVRREPRNGLRGAILLYDDTPGSRRHRIALLSERGYRVDAARDLREAEQLWREREYVLVLVAATRELQAAVHFCDRVRDDDPHQTIGMLVKPDAELPPTTCPDLLWPEEDDSHFVARVETLTEFTTAA